MRRRPSPTRPISSPIRRAMMMRCTASSIPARSNRQHDQAYSDDPYAYQDGYDEAAEEPVPKRRGGMVTVVVVLALAVLGTGAAFAYRTYVGSPRSGEPPIIKADTSPTKIVPAPADANAKVPDRLAAGDGTEKIVPREEAPVDVNAKPGAAHGVSAAEPERQSADRGERGSERRRRRPTPETARMPNSEPRKIKTLSVRGDQPDGAAVPATSPQPPAAKPARSGRRDAPCPRRAANANASSANAPLSLSPQAAQSAPRRANRGPGSRPTPRCKSRPARAAAAAIWSRSPRRRMRPTRRPPIGSCRASIPAVLGSRTPVIKRADLGEKGVYYRAMVGPFGSREEASQFCGSLKTAGGQVRRPKELTAVSLTLGPAAG